MFRNMATSLILHDRIQTTLPKAKDLRSVVEKLVTLGKKDSLHARRLAMSYLMPVHNREEGRTDKRTAVHKLFTEIAPRFAERNGGYTRVLKLGKRDGDKAEVAIIEFVESGAVAKKEKRQRRVVKRQEPTESAPQTETAATPEE